MHRANAPYTTRLADLNDPADLEAVIELLDMYSREPMGQDGPLEGDVRMRLTRDLPRLPNLFVVLAASGTRPVGLAVCLIGYSTFLARPLVNIHDLAVVPEVRGQGVGERLLRAVMAEAVRRGCGRVTLEVRSDNHAAKRLYERIGFSSDGPAHGTEFWTLPLQRAASGTNAGSSIETPR